MGQKVVSSSKLGDLPVPGTGLCAGATEGLRGASSGCGRQGFSSRRCGGTEGGPGERWGRRWRKRQQLDYEIRLSPSRPAAPTLDRLGSARLRTEGAAPGAGPPDWEPAGGLQGPAPSSLKPETSVEPQLLRTMRDPVSSQYSSFIFWRMPIPELDLSELEDLGLLDVSTHKTHGNNGKLSKLESSEAGQKNSPEVDSLLEYSTFNFWRAPIASIHSFELDLI